MREREREREYEDGRPVPPEDKQAVHSVVVHSFSSIHLNNDRRQKSTSDVRHSISSKIFSPWHICYVKAKPTGSNGHDVAKT